VHNVAYDWLQLRRGCVLDSAMLATGDWQVRAFQPAEVGLRNEVLGGLALTGLGV
jgi:hypothetical protein